MSPDLIPQSKKLVDKIKTEIGGNEELMKTDYGHATMNLACGIGQGAEVFDEERQKKHLHDSALELVKNFGKKILNFPWLRDELKCVLSEDEIKLLD